MNTELFIARRLIFSRQKEQRLLRPIIRIAVVSVALSLAVMLVSVAVLTGFKQEISQKVTGFLAHIQIVNYDGNTSYETNPISSVQKFAPQLEQLSELQHLQTFALKPGIITTPTDMQGVVLKGIDSKFDWSFFAENMVSGAPFAVSDSAGTNSVAISQTLAKLLRLKQGDRFDMFFVQEPPRMRRFTVAAIYDTKFSEFDKLYVLCDLKHVQRLNGWSPQQVTGFEIFVKDFEKLDETYQKVEEIAGYKLQPDGTRLLVENIRQRFPQIFDWLALQDLNAWIILALMLAVAGFNMISSLLIMLLERSTMIGLLKALGMQNVSLQKIFIYQSAFIAGQGLLWGNVVGLGFLLLQKYFGIVSLNPETYYLSQVPVALSAPHVLLLNAGALLAITLMLVLPSLLVGRVSPSKTLRFA
ncbi:MAG: ABC transporter permease [Prevotellaceae bacterium]|nr:ABC transporter permease [Prevotellaceae bacterium]